MAHRWSLNRHRWFDHAVLALSDLPSRLMLAVENWREHFALESELAELSAHGALDRALADVGLSRSEIPRLLKGHPSAIRQLIEVMRRAGINFTELGRDQTLKEIEWRCIECRSWHQCRAWLASNRSGDGYRAFCPNTSAFDEMRKRMASVAQLDAQAQAQPATEGSSDSRRI